jgi:hypothetical protein
MLVVVPAEELLKPSTGVIDRAEPTRIVRLVLHGLEVRLLEGVVI